MPDEQTPIVTSTSTTPESVPVLQSTAPLPGESAEQRYERLYGAQSQSTPDPTLSEVQALRTELAALRQALPTTSQSPSSSAGETDEEWVNKIRQGNFKGARESLLQSFQADLQPRLAQVKQEAYNEAISASQVNVEIDRHRQSVLQANPDLAQFERYLTAPVTERIQIAHAAGRIKGPSDLVREYKAAIDGEVASLRNLGAQFRAAGKDDALTRTSDVTRSTPLTPQQVQSTQTQGAPQSQMTEENPGDYFTRRRADEARRKGMG